MERNPTSDPASARGLGSRGLASPPTGASPPPLGHRGCRRRPLSVPASSALAGLLATAALVSAACSGNHRPASTATAGPPIERGTASWYGPKFDGRQTASGERYDMRGLTAAHQSLPFGTLVQVTNLVNGRQVVVRINDRGPFAHHRIIDLSYKAALELEIVGPGTAQVELAILGHGDLVPPLAAPIPPVPPFLVAAAAAEEQPRPESTDEPAAPAGYAPLDRTPDRTLDPTPSVALNEPRRDEPKGDRPRTSSVDGGVHFTVQVGAFGEPERADALRRELAPSYPAITVYSDGLWSRVQIGFFGDRDEAESLRRELAATGIAAIVVTAR
jgi:rare lipoprotein A